MTRMGVWLAKDRVFYDMGEFNLTVPATLVYNTYCNILRREKMQIKVTELYEQPDGTATMTVELDKETTQILIESAIIGAIESAVIGAIKDYDKRTPRQLELPIEPIKAAVDMARSGWKEPTYALYESNTLC